MSGVVTGTPTISVVDELAGLDAAAPRTDRAAAAYWRALVRGLLHERLEARTAAACEEPQGEAGKAHANLEGVVDDDFI